MSKERNIHVRAFKGSSVPVGSKIGKVLINSNDSAKIVSAIRATIKGESQKIQISKSTAQAIRMAKSK